MNQHIKTIIEKLGTDTVFTDLEKAYIEKAIMTADFYEDLLDISIGLKTNTAGLKFNIHSTKKA
ncbi:MAG: hypothetical protein MJZ25_09095 [Fibrobacter sp.]|nr:hypothetical protein [Fibrobacter sp.]